ncbi:hypothetical protein PVAP13_9NG064604, partial [Panicum virgatum]
MRRRWLSADGVLALLHLLDCFLSMNLYGKGGKDQGGAASSQDGERGRETNGGPYPMQSHVLSELLFRQINLFPSDTPVIFSLVVTPKRGSL